MKSTQATNVGLRDVRDDDLSVFFMQQLDPAANRMVAFTKRDPSDRDAFAMHWAKIRADASVTVKTIVADGHVAGHILSFEYGGKPHVGYWVGKSWWGKGVATAALSLFLEALKTRPLFAGAAEDNLASIRVLKKCGFTEVGRQGSFAKARGNEIDEVLLKLD